MAKIVLPVKSMYGTQDASALWQDDCTQVLEYAMYVERTASPALFHNKSEDCRILGGKSDFYAVVLTKC